MPAYALPIITEEFSDLFCYHQSEVSSSLQHILDNLNVDDHIKSEILNAMKQNSAIESALQDFHTTNSLRRTL